ncbi:hypothetical protein FHG87_000125 [Trinorchestia longiramus]|nr:hypothetical protein FHG87_000125 [Trinorchestia longiramus]
MEPLSRQETDSTSPIPALQMAAGSPSCVSKVLTLALPHTGDTSMPTKPRSSNSISSISSDQTAHYLAYNDQSIKNNSDHFLDDSGAHSPSEISSRASSVASSFAHSSSREFLDAGQPVMIPVPVSVSKSGLVDRWKKVFTYPMQAVSTSSERKSYLKSEGDASSISSTDNLPPSLIRKQRKLNRYRQNILTEKNVGKKQTSSIASSSATDIALSDAGSGPAWDSVSSSSALSKSRSTFSLELGQSDFDYQYPVTSLAHLLAPKAASEISTVSDLGIYEFEHSRIHQLFSESPSMLDDCKKSTNSLVGVARIHDSEGCAPRKRFWKVSKFKSNHDIHSNVELQALQVLLSEVQAERDNYLSKYNDLLRKHNTCVQYLPQEQSVSGEKLKVSLADCSDNVLQENCSCALFKSQIGKLSQILEQKNHQLKTFQTNLDQTNAVNKQLELDRVNLSAEREKLYGELESIQQWQAWVKKELQTSQTTRMELQRDLLKTREQLISVRAERDAQMELAEVVSAELRSTAAAHADLRWRAEMAELQLTELKEQRTSGDATALLSNNSVSSHNVTDAVKNDCSKLRGALGEAEAKIAELENLLKNKMDKISACENELMDLRKESTIAQELAIEKDLRMDTLINQMNERNVMISSLNRELLKKEVELRNAKTEKCNLDVKVSSVMSENLEVAQAASKVKEDLSRLTSSLYRMKKDLTHRDQIIESLRSFNGNVNDGDTDHGAAMRSTKNPVSVEGVDCPQSCSLLQSVGGGVTCVETDGAAQERGLDATKKKQSLLHMLQEFQIVPEDFSRNEGLVSASLDSLLNIARLFSESQSQLTNNIAWTKKVCEERDQYREKCLKLQEMLDNIPQRDTDVVYSHHSSSSILPSTQIEGVRKSDKLSYTRTVSDDLCSSAAQNVQVRDVNNETLSLTANSSMLLDSPCEAGQHPNQVSDKKVHAASPTSKSERTGNNLRRESLEISAQESNPLQDFVSENKEKCDSRQCGHAKDLSYVRQKLIVASEAISVNESHIHGLKSQLQEQGTKLRNVMQDLTTTQSLLQKHEKQENFNNDYSLSSDISLLLQRISCTDDKGGTSATSDADFKNSCVSDIYRQFENLKQSWLTIERLTPELVEATCRIDEFSEFVQSTDMDEPSSDNAPEVTKLVVRILCVMPNVMKTLQKTTNQSRALSEQLSGMQRALQAYSEKETLLSERVREMEMQCSQFVKENSKLLSHNDDLRHRVESLQDTELQNAELRQELSKLQSTAYGLVSQVQFLGKQSSCQRDQLAEQQETLYGTQVIVNKYENSKRDLYVAVESPKPEHENLNRRFAEVDEVNFSISNNAESEVRRSSDNKNFQISQTIGQDSQPNKLQSQVTSRTTKDDLLQLRSSLNFLTRENEFLKQETHEKNSLKQLSFHRSGRINELDSVINSKKSESEVQRNSSHDLESDDVKMLKHLHRVSPNEVRIADKSHLFSSNKDDLDARISRAQGLCSSENAHINLPQEEMMSSRSADVLEEKKLKNCIVEENLSDVREQNKQPHQLELMSSPDFSLGSTQDPKDEDEFMVEAKTSRKKESYPDVNQAVTTNLPLKEEVSNLSKVQFMVNKKVEESAAGSPQLAPEAQNMKRISELELCNAQLSSQVKQLEDENCQLAARAKEHEDSNYEITERLMKFAFNDVKQVEGNNKLTDQVKQLEGNNCLLTNQVKQFEGNNCQLTDQMKQLEDNNHQLIDQVSLLECNDCQLTDQVKKLENDNSQLTDQVKQLEGNNCQLTDQVKKLENDNCQLTDQVKQLEGNNCQLTDQVKQLDDNNCQLTEQVKQLEGNNCQLTDQVKKLENNCQLTDQVKQLEGNNCQLTDQVKKLENDNCQLTDQVKQLEGNNCQLTDQVKQLDDNNCQLTEQVKQLEGKNYQLTDQVKQLEGNNCQLTDQVEKLEGNNCQLTDQVEKLEGNNCQLTDRVKQLEGNNCQLTDQVKELSGDNSQLTDQVKELSGDNSQLTDQVKELSGDNSQLTDQVKELSGDNSQLIDRVKQLEGNNYQLTDQVKELRGNNSQLTDQVKEFGGDISQLTDQVKLLEGNNCQLTDQMKKFENENCQLTDQVKQLQNDNCQLTDQVKELSGDNSQLTDLVKQLEGNNCQLTDQVKEFENGNCQLTDKVKQLEGNNCQLTDQVEKLENDNCQLTDQVKKLKNDNCQLTDLVKELGGCNSQLTDQVKELSGDNSQLTDLVKQLEGNNCQLTDQVKELIGNNSQLTDQVKEFTGDISQLTDQVKLIEDNNCQLTEQMKQLEGNNCQLTDQMKKFENDNCQLTDQVKKLENDNCQLTDQVKELRGDNSQLTDRVKQLEGNNCHLTLQVKQLEGNNCQLTDRAKQLENDNCQLTDQVKQLEGNNFQLTDQVKLLEGNNYQLTDQVKQLEGNNCQLTDQVKQLEGNNCQLTDRVKQLEGNNCQLTDQVKQLEGNNCQLTDQVEKLENDNYQLSDQVKKLENDNYQLSDQVKKLENDSCQLTDQVKEFSSDISQLTDQVKLLEVNNCQLTDQVKQLEGNNCQLTEQVKQLEGYNCQLADQVKQFEDNNCQLTDQLKQMEGNNCQLTDQVSLLEGNNCQLMDQVSRLEGNNCQLIDRVKQLEGNNCQLTDQVQELESKIPLHVEQAKLHEEKIMHLESQVRVLSDKENDLNVRIVEVGHEKLLLDEEVSVLQQKLDESELQRCGALEESKEHASKLCSLNAENVNVSFQVQQLRCENSQLKELIADTNAKVNELNAVNETKMQMGSLPQTSHDHLSQITKVIESMKFEKNGLTGKVKQLQSANFELIKQLKKLEDKNSGDIRVSKVSEGQKQSLEIKINEQETVIKDLSDQLNEALARSSEMESRCDKLLDEKCRLNNLTKELATKVSDLEQQVADIDALKVTLSISGQSEGVQLGLSERIEELLNFERECKSLVEECQRKDNENITLSKQIEDIQLNESKLNRRVKELLDKEVNYLKQIEEIQGKFCVLSNVTEVHQNREAELNDSIEELRNRNVELSNELAKHQGCEADFRKQINELLCQNDKFSKKVSEYTSSEAKLVNQLRLVEISKQEFCEAIKEHEEREAQLTHEMELLYESHKEQSANKIKHQVLQPDTPVDRVCGGEPEISNWVQKLNCEKSLLLEQADCVQETRHEVEVLPHESVAQKLYCRAEFSELRKKFREILEEDTLLETKLYELEKLTGCLECKKIGHMSDIERNRLEIQLAKQKRNPPGTLCELSNQIQTQVNDHNELTNTNHILNGCVLPVGDEKVESLDLGLSVSHAFHSTPCSLREFAMMAGVKVEASKDAVVQCQQTSSMPNTLTRIKDEHYDKPLVASSSVRAEDISSCETAELTCINRSSISNGLDKDPAELTLSKSTSELYRELNILRTVNAQLNQKLEETKSQFIEAGDGSCLNSNSPISDSTGIVSSKDTVLHAEVASLPFTNESVHLDTLGLTDICDAASSVDAQTSEVEALRSQLQSMQKLKEEAEAKVEALQQQLFRSASQESATEVLRLEDRIVAAASYPTLCSDPRVQDLECVELNSSTGVCAVRSDGSQVGNCVDFLYHGEQYHLKGSVLNSLHPLTSQCDQSLHDATQPSRDAVLSDSLKSQAIFAKHSCNEASLDNRTEVLAQSSESHSDDNLHPCSTTSTSEKPVSHGNNSQNAYHVKQFTKKSDENCDVRTHADIKDKVSNDVLSAAVRREQCKIGRRRAGYEAHGGLSPNAARCQSVGRPSKKLPGKRGGGRLTAEMLTTGCSERQTAQLRSALALSVELRSALTDALMHIKNSSSDVWRDSPAILGTSSCLSLDHPPSSPPSSSSQPSDEGCLASRSDADSSLVVCSSL